MCDKSTSQRNTFLVITVKQRTAFKGLFSGRTRTTQRCGPAKSGMSSRQTEIREDFNADRVRCRMRNLSRNSLHDGSREN